MRPGPKVRLVLLELLDRLALRGLLVQPAPRVSLGVLAPLALRVPQGRLELPGQLDPLGRKVPRVRLVSLDLLAQTAPLVPQGQPA